MSTPSVPTPDPTPPAADRVGLLLPPAIALAILTDEALHTLEATDPDLAVEARDLRARYKAAAE